MINKIIQVGLMPLFNHTDANVVKQVIEACYKGGSPFFEYTNRGDYALSVFEEFIGDLSPEIQVGVGSVVDVKTAQKYIDLGAKFIVMPYFKEDVVKHCLAQNIPCAPGCGTLTEMARAYDLGCELVKLFPGSVYGSGFIKNVKAPCPWLNIMPTGGVSPTRENLSDWMQAGASCVGMGSKLIKKEWIANEEYDKITEAVKHSLEIIQEFK